ncbi:hypothetical protein BBP40_010959 [Aspergillus hancockii]|nr:hypothetical protein BBP40_010959 [Aspergillus hancockii]
MSSDTDSVEYGVEYAEEDAYLEGPGAVFVEDDDWDLMPVDDESLEAYYSLKTKIADMGYLAYSDGNMYFYIDAARQWSLLTAKDSLARVCKIMGSTNVSVSTAEAVEHYYPWLAKRAIVNAALPLQRSICIGTRRIEVATEGECIVFTKGRRITEVPSHADQRAAEMCTYPVMATKLPVAWRWPGGAAIYNHIVPLFTDPRDFLTVLWHVGNCIVDPVQMPRCLLMMGPGGSGKSRVINAMVTALEGCVGVLPDGTFTSGSSHVTEKVLKQLISSRMVTCADVDLDNNKLDIHALRTIVSGDYVTLGPFRSRILSSATLATNGMIDPRGDDTLTSDAVVRRVVAIYMDAAASRLDFEQIPHFQEARADFVCACAYIRLTHKYIPVTPRTVLLSLAGKAYMTIKDMVEEAEEPTLADYISVLSIIQAATGIHSSEIGYKAALINPETVIQIGKRKFLRGLRPTEDYR